MPKKEVIATPIPFNEIEDAFFFVSSGSYGMNSALVDLKTGRKYYRSDLAGIDEIEGNDDIDWDSIKEIPHKNDLGLGKELVFRFVADKLPDDYEEVRDMFARRGAYTRFKDFLQSKRLLEAWYDFEDEQTKAALREWCEDNGLVLDD